MAEKRKRPITQAGGLDINDVKKWQELLGQI